MVMIGSVVYGVAEFLALQRVRLNTRRTRG